jgi:hypothetical protein
MQESMTFQYWFLNFRVGQPYGTTMSHIVVELNY